MIEDQVLFHLTKFGKIILSLLTFPDPLKGRDEAVPQGLRSASLNPVATLPVYDIATPDVTVPVCISGYSIAGYYY